LVIDEHLESFIVRDATGQALGYFYFEGEFGRRSADVRFETILLQKFIADFFGQ
jgi:hypothetical protein